MIEPQKIVPDSFALDKEPAKCNETKLLINKNMDSLAKTNSPCKPMINEDNCLEAGYYVHKKSLGEGGFGKVRLGTHLKTNQKVAIKMMNKEKLGQDLQRVRIEIEALKVLQHDNIAKLLQVIETNTEIYLILEYCSGGELFDYLISKKRLSENEVRVIMKDLFQVLLYIHNRGFAHRDLKPENILFDEKHKIKLIDFGLAANSSQNKAALAFLSTCCGSPAYAAPELLRGLTYSGPAVDVWSAGVLLYSLLVGQLPFDDENINNLYKKIQVGRFVMPQWLSSDVRDLISAMLKTNPADRITVTKVLQHKWLKRGTPNQSEFKIPTEVGFDQEAFKCCKLLFPNVNETQLESKIKNFGYHTSAYLLLKNNPDAIKAVKESLQTRTLAQQTQQLSMSANAPRIAAIKRKLQLDCDTNNNVTPVKRTRDVNNVSVSANKPRTPVIRPRVIPHSQNNSPRFPVIEQRQLIPSSLKKNSPKTPTRIAGRLNEKVARKIVSPKMRTRPANENSCENKGLNGISLAGNSVTPKKPQNSIKSPLRQINNQIIASPDLMKTPVNVLKRPLIKGSTSKKSLLKRLMASATPAKSHSPRKLTCSTNSNNITMTSFKDPQECINRLVYTLRAKGVECKQKDFSLKCFFSDKIHSSLKFDLEICRFNGVCVIHRKRLKGDAWNYKKICELILQLSNEQQPATDSAKVEVTRTPANTATISTPL